MSLTNPGTIGTLHSVPRLMPGQGVIVGVGAITYPPEYEGADPQTLAEIGVSKTVTLTSTYDHRIIQGAESGEFLAKLHDLLLGGDGFYDDIFASFGVPYEPARWSPDRSPLEGSVEAQHKVIAVQQLINMYRVRGHLIANLDPLGLKEPRTHEELDPNHWGLTIWDLDREFPTGGLAGRESMKLRDILGVLRDAYARTIGVEYMHIQEPDQKAWIQQKVEGVHGDTSLDDKRRILSALNGAEAFERFLHTKFLGQKRFSLEGAETLIPMLDFLIDGAADDGRRGGRDGHGAPRPPQRARQRRRQVVRADLPRVRRRARPERAAGFGRREVPRRRDGQVHRDVGRDDRHHARREPEPPRSRRPRRRRHGARQAGPARRHATHDHVLSVLIHGDAAFAGQGVVAETLNLSELPGYDVGGTVHIVVNNQVGFTTTPGFARSTVYATDIAKAVQAPIFHVNGDDPEAVGAHDPARDRVPQRLQERRRRRHGLLPALRAQRERRARVHAAAHVRGDRQAALDPQALHGAARQPRRPHARGRRARARRLPRRGWKRRSTRPRRAYGRRRPSPTDAPEPTPSHVDTGVPREQLDHIVDRAHDLPRRASSRTRSWRASSRTGARSSTPTRSTGRSAEALAFGSLLLEGTPVRVAGQDTRRGTFSQRHASIVDHRTEQEYTPLDHLGADAAPFMIYDTVLSEFAALGFEYGYSVSDHDALVCWEAQFGDFDNGAQTIIDQFIVAAEDKWGQRSGLVMLLPHGFEGQGPEHSSARLERFLVLSRAGQHPRRVPHDRGAVLPRAAPPGARPDPQAAHRDDTEALPAHAGDRVARRRVHVRRFRAGARRPRAARRRRSASIFCTGKFGQELIARRDADAGAGRGRAARAALPVAARRDRGRAGALSRRGRVLGAGGTGQHGRALLRPAPHRGDRRPVAPSTWSPAPRARAPRPAARRCTTPSRMRSSTPRSAPRAKPFGSP